MFDREYAAAAVASISPFQQGQVATACLVRVADLLDDPRVSADFGAVAALVHKVSEYAVDRAEGRSPQTDPSALNQGVRDVLGPREAPYEELPGWGAWAMDVASLADYVLRTWADVEDSARNCFNVLLAAYSAAAFLEDDSDDSEVPPLAEGEARRQRDDIVSLTRGDGWGDVLREATVLARTYVYWFRHVTA
ncbi:hypothetical protein [Actinacidiphila acididurans]|uniref:Uncharacterized protein n=1 Tax=Actinacidiphila acididurans TaxID=2784346 RepID=A0ABS2U414_9ACTN|nr:hypothetical protein [Actinacidiphila acididurans]MBM9509486.1 hypothetical protein [Actinacidiphila acididurans]